jgi:hypothetical protein
MAETKTSLAEQLKGKLSTLFLHTTFNSIGFLKEEVAKHMEISDSEIKLTELEVKKDSEGNVTNAFYNLNLLGTDFTIRFDHKVKEAKVLNVPRVVKNDKKWWQINVPDTKVIVEQKREEPKEYWVLSSIAV